MNKAITVSANGRVEVVDMPDSGHTMKFMQEIVGGYYECVSVVLPDSRETATMWVNEEGLLRGLPYNLVASVLASRGRNSTMQIVGNVLITGDADEYGDDTYFDGSLAAQIAESIRLSDIALDLVN